MCEAVHNRSNKLVAIKKILHLFEDKIETKRLVREIQLLRKMNNNNIVKLYDIVEPPNRNNFEYLFLVLECA